MNNRINCTLALLVAASVSAVAGPDTSSTPDAKDMKGMQTMQTMESDAGMYVGIDGGADVAQHNGNNRTDFRGVSPGNAGTDFQYRGSNENNIGPIGGLKVGYNFESMALGGDFRLQPAVEVEGYYLGTRLADMNSFGPGDRFSVNGNINSAVLMLNSLVRLKTGTIFTPYIGAGAGVEFQTLTGPSFSEQDFGTDKLQHNSNDFAPAVQGIAGFDIELAKHWTLFTEYKFVVAIDPQFNTGDISFGGGNTYNLKYQPTYMADHVVSTGLKYSF